MVSRFPFWIDNRTLSGFDDAITRHEACSACSVYKFDVRPLVAMMVNVIGYLGKQYAFILEYSVSFLQERRESVGKCIVVFFGGAQHEAEAFAEIFFVIPALIWNMRRVIHNDFERGVPKRHCRVVRYQGWAVTTLDVQPHYLSLAALPEPAAIHGRVQYLTRLLAGVEGQHPF